MSPHKSVRQLTLRYLILFLGEVLSSFAWPMLFLLAEEKEHRVPVGGVVRQEKGKLISFGQGMPTMERIRKDAHDVSRKGSKFDRNLGSFP